MSSSHESEFVAQLQSALRLWSQTADEPLNLFLSDIVGESRATAILETLVGISIAHGEVRSARDLGRTRAAWLSGVLKEELPGEMWSEFLDSPLQNLTELSQGAPHTAVSGALAKMIEGSFTITDEFLGGELSFEADVTILEEATEFFRSPMGSEIEEPVKAVASAATLRFLEERESQIPAPAVVAAIDLGLETAKVGYKVAVGEKKPADGIEHLQDRAVAGIAEAIRKVAPAASEKVGYVVGSALGQMVGMAPAGAIAGRALGRMAGEHVAKHAEVGARKIVKVIKSVSQSITRATKSVWSATKSFVGGLFGA